MKIKKRWCKNTLNGAHEIGVGQRSHAEFCSDSCRHQHQTTARRIGEAMMDVVDREKTIARQRMTDLSRKAALLLED